MSDADTDEKKTQSFNDDELKDIMSEIESLESDHNSEKAEVEAVAEVVAPQESSETENSEPESALEAVQQDDSVVSISKDLGEPQHKKSSNTAMDFHVEGDMSLALSFNIAGKPVKLSVNSEDGFVIELAGGAKFYLPLEDSKKSA